MRVRGPASAVSVISCGFIAPPTESPAIKAIAAPAQSVFTGPVLVALTE
jgi:hypothetical protein